MCNFSTQSKAGIIKDQEIQFRPISLEDGSQTCLSFQFIFLTSSELYSLLFMPLIPCCVVFYNQRCFSLPILWPRHRKLGRPSDYPTRLAVQPALSVPMSDYRCHHSPRFSTAIIMHDPYINLPHHCGGDHHKSITHSEESQINLLKLHIFIRFLMSTCSLYVKYGFIVNHGCTGWRNRTVIQCLSNKSCYKTVTLAEMTHCSILYRSSC